MGVLSTSSAAGATQRLPGRFRRLLWLLSLNPGLTAGLLLLTLMVAAALLGPSLTQYQPLTPDAAVQLAAPSSQHYFGTDEFGRDILSRVVHAAQLDLVIAVSVTLLALAGGALIGAVAGFCGGWVDAVVSRVVDILMAFPAFILAMGVTAMLGNKVINVILALAIAYMPFFVRLTRAEMLTLREAEFADAARCIGAPPWRIMLLHLLPNAIGPALTQATLTLGWAILDAAGLSFLGLGIKPPTPEWGVMIGDGTQHIFSGEWWTSFFPGAAVLLAVLTFNLIADGLRELQEEK